MQIPETRFWRLTLAEWRAMLDGFEDRQRADRRARAWEVSHLLIAAGCKPDDVTPAKLLGEKERRRKPEPPKMSPEDAAAILFSNRRPAEVSNGTE